MMSGKDPVGGGVSPHLAAELAELFRRNGYLRRQSSARVRRDGWDRYKKGDEIRFVANSREELRRIEALLRKVGFRPGRPFAKGRQFRLPVYGRNAVAALVELFGLGRDA